MSIFRRFIIKEWVTSFLGSFLSLFVVFTIASLVSELMRGVAPFKDILVNYFLELPRWLDKMLPIACLVGSLFCINKLKNRNELVAIFASGYSRKNFVISILIGAFFVGSIQLFSSAFLAPYSKKMRPTILGKADSYFRVNKRQGIRFSSFDVGKMWFRMGNTYVSFNAYDKLNKIMTDVDLHIGRDDMMKMQTWISAKKAKFESGNNWVLEDGITISNLDNLEFAQYSTFTNQVKSLGVSFQDFEELDSDITTLSIFKLKTYIDSLNNLGILANEYEMIFWNMITPSIYCLLFSLVSLMAVFSPNRRGASFGKNVLFVFIFVMFFWFGQGYFQSYGANGKMDPVVASFSMIILVGLFVSYNFFRNRVLK